KMKQSGLVFAALILAMQGQARSQQYVTGNDLLNYCMDASKQVFCVAYIQGVSDAVSNAQQIGKLPQRGQGCVRFPDGVTAPQGADVVTRWLQAHPELRHLGAGGCVHGALSEAWPCPAR